ncbi:MAG: DUF1302 domain-containing protein [Usitatibacter sp.]
MKASRPVAKPLALAIALAAAGPALAVQFEFDNGLKASVDTTISYGVSVRTQSPDPALYGIANGGTSRSVNEDDGDLNFKKNRPFANVIKATSDVELKWKNWGFFGRGTCYYDFDLHDSDKLGPTGRDRLGQDCVGLDGFVSGVFEPDGKTLRLRAGRQVISWGESTFIPNGINVINPVDLSKLRIPGSELKEGLIPTTGLWGSLELSKAASVEGFYLTNFDKIRLDPRGSYFSNNDAASDDADRVIVSFGRRRDQHTPPGNPVPPASAGTGALGTAAQALYGPFDPAAQIWVPRSADHNPSDSGQYGVAFRYLAHEFNNTEFGLYYMNYHSRVPFFAGVKGTTTSILTGGPLITPICGVAALRALCATGTATYYTEYPEDIRLFGLSFNTAGPMGIALQGEYSYRPNQPVQIATAELILASLGLPNVITGFTQIPGAPAGATAAALVPDGTYIQGYRRVKASQAQVTATKSIPNLLKADQLVLVGEVGAVYLHDLPSDLKFSGPAAYLPATSFGALVSSAYSVQTEGFATKFSWGYRLAGRLEYANMLYGGTVSPRIAFAHDVKGVSPTFNEDTKSASIGVSWDYQRKWLVDLQYTSFFGGRTYCGTDVPPAGSVVTPGQPASFCSSANPLKDRDFYSLSVSYSF